MSDPSQDATTPELLRTADRLHSAALHLLRWVRAVDTASGLSAPRLSVLSVLVFGGPRTVGELAAAEQVRPPTITRLVQALEREGLVRRTGDRRDGRIQRIHATARGRTLLQAGRQRRIDRLASGLERLSPDERAVLDRAAVLLTRVVRGE